MKNERVQKRLFFAYSQRVSMHVSEQSRKRGHLRTRDHNHNVIDAIRWRRVDRELAASFRVRLDAGALAGFWNDQRDRSVSADIEHDEGAWGRGFDREVNGLTLRKPLLVRHH